jgi:RNA polymerase sigma-70 factor (ECF subfamily)
MNLESTPSTALSPEAIAHLVKGHREFLAFLERRVESQRRGGRHFASGLYPWTGTRGRRAGRKGRRLVLSGAPQRRDRSLPATVHHRASDGSLGREFPDVQEPEAELRQEICHCVSGLLETLKPEYREALRIVDLEEGKLKDLAQQSGITAENAAVRVHRARAALRRRIEQACGTCSVHGCLDCSCEASTGSKCGG